MGAPPSAPLNQGNTPGLQRPPNSQPQIIPQQFGIHQSPMNQQRPQMGIPEQQQFGNNTAELAFVKAKYQDHLNKNGLVQQTQQPQQAVPQQRPVSMSRPQSAQQMLPAAQPQIQKPIVQTPKQQMPVPAGVSSVTQPPQQVKAPLPPGQINPNFVLSPEQVTLMDTKEVPRQILGQLSNQIPLQFKTWGQVKAYLAQNNAPPQYLDALRTRQAQHYQLLARAQMMRRAQAQGSVPQPPQSQSQSQPQPQPQSQPPQPPQPQPQLQPQPQPQPQKQQPQQAQQHQHQQQQQQIPISQPPPVANAPPTPVQRPPPTSGNLPNLQSLNPAQLQQLQARASQGKLSPQQNAHLQQQIYNIRQNQERQRAAAVAAQRTQQPPNPAPQAPAQQTPKQATVARPQQQPGSDSPSAPKKLKRERDGNEDIVVLDQRPASQMSNQHLMTRPIPHQVVSQQPQFVTQVPPGQKSLPQQAPLQQHQAKNQATQHMEIQQSAQQAQEDINQAQQKAVISSLLKMLEEERNSHDGRPPLQLPQQEKELLHLHLSDANTKNMIRRTDQLLPMFVLLGGTSKATRELIRTVLLIPFLC